MRVWIDDLGEVHRKVIFNVTKEKYLDKIDLNNGFVDEITLPCRKCVECCQEYSSMWSYRIMKEASLYEVNCFITLTYANNPKNLIKRDIQLFLKRLRKRLEPRKIRYFLCGEYGSKNGRPHYHLIIFNYKPDDLEYFFTDKQHCNLYKSKFIADIWNKGFVLVGDLTLNSAKYCAKYLQKAVFKDNEDFEVKPFVSMSLKPGIGLSWFLENQHLLETDKIYHDGYYIKLPRYFLDYSEKKLLKDLTNLKKYRIIKSKLFERAEKELQLKREQVKEKLNL